MPLVCFISGCKSSYPELEVLHPLPYHFILWGRGVGHLELEQVIASWSIAILVKHNRGAGTACAEQSKREDAKKKKEKVLDVGVEKQKTKNPLPRFSRLLGGLQGQSKGVCVPFSKYKPPKTKTHILNLCDNNRQKKSRKLLSSLLTTITLSYLLPIHHHACTMPTGRIYSHI